MQSAPDLQPCATPHLGQPVPPQSVPVSPLLLTPSVHEVAWQRPLVQLPAMQSPATLHMAPTAQGGHTPPQSMSVSSGPCVPSLHDDCGMPPEPPPPTPPEPPPPPPPIDG